MTGATAIIGAGLAGLTLARRLAAHGQPVLVVDKGRGLGGRCNTRRTDLGPIDYGVQVLDPSDDRVARLVALSGLKPIAVPLGGNEWWRMPGGASALPKALAKGLDVRTEVEVRRITGRPGDWSVETATQALGPFARVILTAPAPQTRMLWPLEEPPAFATARMAPCWVALLGFDHALPLPTGPCEFGPELAWQASWDHGRTWLLQARNAWSATHVELDKHEAAQALLAVWQRHWGQRTPPAFLFGHRWRYGQTAVAAGVPCHWEAATGLGACGDWFLGSSAGDAIGSANALADVLI
jgi:renalase